MIAAFSSDPPSFGFDFVYLSSKLLGPLCIHTSEVHHGPNHGGCQDLNKTQRHLITLSVSKCEIRRSASKVDFSQRNPLPNSQTP